MKQYDRPTAPILHVLEVVDIVRQSRWFLAALPFVAIIAGFAVAVILFAWIGATSPL